MGREELSLNASDEELKTMEDSRMISETRLARYSLISSVVDAHSAMREGQREASMSFTLKVILLFGKRKRGRGMESERREKDQGIRRENRLPCLYIC